MCVYACGKVRKIQNERICMTEREREREDVKRKNEEE